MPDRAAQPRPSTVYFKDADLAYLRERLAHTRWPDEPPDSEAAA